MDDESKKALKAMQAVLEELLSGKQCSTTEVHTLLPEIQTLSIQINQLIKNLHEMNRLAVNLSQGKLADTGKLFNVCNDLIDQAARTSTQETGTAFNMAMSFNSWRYHQILQTLDLLHVLVLEVDDSGHVVYTNRPAKEVFGDIEYLSEQTASNVLGFITTNIAINKEENTFPVFREIYEEINSTWYRVVSDRFLLPDGQAFYFNSIENINEWKISEYQLKMSAALDEMTGTYNRKAGLEELEKLLSRGNPAETNCIAFIDIDGLKTINDNFGHSEGDYTIKSIANVLLSSIRGSDTVCRYGGDEFLIIFKSCTEEVAEKIITRMCEKLKNLDRKNPKPYALSFSHGMVSFSNRSGPNYKAAKLLELADQKMYQCKKQKKLNANRSDG